MERVAIIDLGSNSVRLVMIDVDHNKAYRIINEVKETVRLSENMGEEGFLQPDAMLRTLRAIKHFKKLCEVSNITQLIAVATAAVRSARNQKEFLELLSVETGIQFTVISGEREAALGFMGVVYTLDIQNGYTVDIGGASTEVTYFENRQILSSISLPFGAVNLTERFLDKNLSSEKQIHALEKYLHKQLLAVPWLRKRDSSLPLVGMGGTIRALSKIDRVNNGYGLELTHGYSTNAVKIKEIYEDLRYRSLEERMAIPGITKDRADILVAGACAVHQLLDMLGCSKLIVSGSGIRDGLFYDYYQRHLLQAEIKDVSQFSINNLLKLYSVNLHHANHVKNLALELFDQLAALHKLPSEYRRVLEKAALLHDIGIAVDFYNRDEHTFYLVTNSRLNGLNHREVLLVAFIASKFTGDKLRRNYARYRGILTKEDNPAVKKLVMLLALSDKLDKGKSSVVRELYCSIKKDSVTIETDKAAADAELELAEANKLQPMFKKLFGKQLLVR